MPPAHGKYAKRPDRKTVTPPHVRLRALRTAGGLTMDQVIDRVQEEFPGEFVKLSRGTLSAIENGDRGASPAMLRALCFAYGLPDGAITTDYVPRKREVTVAEDAA